MRRLFDMIEVGVHALILNRMRSVATVFALLAGLVPYLVGLGISKGIEQEAESSVRFGADLYVTGAEFGRWSPVPLAEADQISRIPGVTRVSPRIVGTIALGKEGRRAVVVGLSPDQLPAWSPSVDGELPHPGSRNELVVGSGLARHLGLKKDSIVPPFYRNDRQGEHLCRVVGIFRFDGPFWQTNLILTSLETAAEILDQPGLATELLVYCQPDQEASVARAITQVADLTNAAGNPLRLRVTSRAETLARLSAEPLRRESLFSLHFLLLFVSSMLAILVTSGVGSEQRRREIGILKATGWQTDQILLRGAVESCCLSLLGACIALIAAWVWLRLFNGYGIAAYFLVGAEEWNDLRIPFKMAPIPILFAVVLSFAMVSIGSLYSSWRLAVVPPREAIRS
jgi:ABC-type lipoprotein release transport system permease subunit